MPRINRPVAKDMYWFAHGGGAEKSGTPPRTGEEEEVAEATASPTCKANDRRFLDDTRPASHTDGSNSSGPSSLEYSEKRFAVEERRKQMWEAEQERNEAVLRKHMEREAALEARRNASRSTIAFAFGSSVPRNVETLHTNGQGAPECDSPGLSPSGGLSPREQNHDIYLAGRRSVSPLNFLTNGIVHFERKGLSPPSWLVGSAALIGEDLMSKSMTGSFSTTCGRRKNDLTPTVRFERTTAAPKSVHLTRKRSVSMTRLDQLALPRKHYVDAVKASNSQKENMKSPTRPLSSASENSGGSNQKSGNSKVTLRARSSPRKPRPVSIAGTLPDHRSSRTSDVAKVSPVKRSHTPSKRTPGASGEVGKTPESAVHTTTPKSSERSKPRPATAPKLTTPKTPKTRQPTPPKARQPTPPRADPKHRQPTPAKAQPTSKKSTTHLKAKADAPFMPSPPVDAKEKVEEMSQLNESQRLSESEESERNSNSKRIISEEEAKAGLAEKRRLAREQAEKEAEVERQRQQELHRAEEERREREAEEEQRVEEEALRLLEDHRRGEEEKLRRAIQEQEQREEEERTRREEETRTKAEQEKRAKEEAEKQRLELEEKLRKEEEERAERKKRLEKIMSRTRGGKSNGTSPSGSISGSEQLDSSENQQDGFSSGANSLESNEGGEETKANIGDSTEVHPTHEASSEGESLNSNDLMLPDVPSLSSVIVSDSEDTVHEEKMTSQIPDSEQAGCLQETTPEVKSQLNANAAEFTSFNVHAPEFTPSGFGGVNPFGQEQVTSVEDLVQSDFKSSETFAVPVQWDAVPESAPIITDSREVNLQFGDATESPNVVDSVANLVNCDMSAAGFQLPDPEGDMPRHGSVSSDIKLPDPIYETSDDGSVSSERHHQDFRGLGNEEFNSNRVSENVGFVDDVFSEQSHVGVESMQSSNPFGQGAFVEIQPSVADGFVVQESVVDDEDQFQMNYKTQNTYDMSAGIYDMQTSSSNPDFLGESEEEVIPSRSSTSSVVETDKLPPASHVLRDVLDDSPQRLDKNFAFGDAFDATSNEQFLTGESNTQHISALENPFETSANRSFVDEFNVGPGGDNPFAKSISQDFDFHQVQALGDHTASSLFAPDAFDIESDMSNVTIVRADDEACIGIVSSLANDEALNHFTNGGYSEGRKLEFATESEDSSLDSNLSQVMSAEGGDDETTGGLNNHVETNSTKLSNGDLGDNPFADHCDISSKSNGNHFDAPQMTLNGYGRDSSKPADVILGVARSVPSDVSEGVSEAGGKDDPQDPFLVKAIVSGNPFATQHQHDGQKPLLVTTDFLN